MILHHVRWDTIILALGRFAIFAVAVGVAIYLVFHDKKFAASIEQPAKQQSCPKTKAEMRAFIKAHQEQGKGWIK
jgi:hypothetical protein